MEKNGFNAGHEFGTAPQMDNMKDVESSSSEPRAEVDHRTAFGSYRSHIWKYVFWGIRFFVIMAFPGILLSIPVIINRNNKFLDDNAIDSADARQDKQVIFYIFLWLVISWIGVCLSYLLGCALPYIFRFIARYLNPAHLRYWRTMRVMKRPIAAVGLVMASYLSFEALIYWNDDLAVNFNLTPDQMMWAEVIADFLQQGTLWAGFYFIEKIIVLYITIHFHYRSDLGKITHSKDMQNALMALYEASIYLYPVGTPEFSDEDVMIGNATGSEHGEYRVRATRYLARLGIDTYHMTTFFGNFLTSDKKSHWLKPGSSYAMVERAIANPKSAAALARRIWMSIVPVGKDVLTAQDIAEVLGPFRKEDADKYFTIIDEGECGDIRLDEMEWTVVEAGRIRNMIYRNMDNADHCINTFDWVAQLFLGAIMLFFILVYWVPSLKDIQETIKFFTVGLAFAAGRTVHHFLAGVVFILFDHPYDIGDKVELWSNQSPQSVSLVVVRTSLLYTVFRRVDNWMELQVANEYLQQCRIENVTRSGSNRQHITMMIDVRTTFKDLAYLRAELEAFLKENKRDYLPNLALQILGVHDLSRLEMKVVFTHRTNWSNEPLRAGRSMKFMCALVSAIRKVPIIRPDGGPIGGEGRPMFNVMLSEKEANQRLDNFKANLAASRIDAKDDIPVAPAEFGDKRQGVNLEENAMLLQQALEEADRKRAEKEAKEAEERDAIGRLAKIPAIQRKGAPVRADGTSTGVDVASTTGLRSLPHFRG
ncbi:hypothetical protein B0H63DRAFT_450216 [Podospora didyma]|uniref:Mechanosensitive ion channel protein n=1 Tax=Podospora didyma TaxID=330526 RepID=A0AAE0NG27_9PEZI|nr:hypothetical protein B0H63DRAFT_450216 [Podospora didyma]